MFDRMNIGCYDENIQNEVLVMYEQLDTFEEKSNSMQA